MILQKLLINVIKNFRPYMFKSNPSKIIRVVVAKFYLPYLLQHVHLNSTLFFFFFFLFGKVIILVVAPQFGSNSGTIMLVNWVVFRLGLDRPNKTGRCTFQVRPTTFTVKVAWMAQITRVIYTSYHIRVCIYCGPSNFITKIYNFFIRLPCHGSMETGLVKYFLHSLNSFHLCNVKLVLQLNVTISNRSHRFQLNFSKHIEFRE